MRRSNRQRTSIRGKSLRYPGAIRVQTVWLQPKLDRIPFFFKNTGFFLDFAQPDVPRKHALFDLMEEISMIGIQIRK